ncbi:MAG TPA: hypothetical protein VKY39_00295, partial [Aggregatilineales bacterium]|nr:hypothetical protein [Aggregatilineales bacterium]
LLLGCDDSGGDDADGGNATGTDTTGTTGGGTGVELLDMAALEAGWIGGDPMTADDDPGGVQGAIYLYGDETSCTFTMGENPCTAAGCCISGATITDPTFAAWGCGIGISLNETGGDASTKLPYKGSPTATFNYTFTGDTGGNQLRAGFTQFNDTAGLVSPYLPINAFTNGVQGSVSFDTATYPSWCSTSEDCLAPPDRMPADPGAPADPAAAHDLQFQIAGGERDGAFSLCLTSLTVSG